MIPPPDVVARPKRRDDALSFAMRRLWPAIDVAPDSLEADAIRDALLRPASSMLDRGGKRFRGHMVDLCWQLGGGEGPCPDALPAVIEGMYAVDLRANSEPFSLQIEA